MNFFWTIFFSTFILEDVALATSVALVAANKIDFNLGFLACFLGISIGDLALYFFGWAASHVGFLKRSTRLQTLFKKINTTQSLDLLSASIVISRFIPGTRLVTYVGAGLLHFSFWRFFFLTLGSVFIWVALVLLGGHSLRGLFASHWILGLGIFVLLLHSMRPLIRQLLDPWDRKALQYSWLKWSHFEFWPPWLFYLPIIPLYIYRSLRGGSFLLPFYANPQILNGGLIGESKLDFLKHLDPKDPATLTLLATEECQVVENALNVGKVKFPFVLKPDIGQRGYGVRIIHKTNELMEYFEKKQKGIVLAQALSRWPREAGIFYFRYPNKEKGEIFSITDKEFPFVTGDGLHALGDLILRDQRARIIAGVYFSRHRDRLNNLIPAGEKFALAECGNHCQGAIFLNGRDLHSPQLVDRIDQLAKEIPGFYFGRFDIRYNCAEDLKKGLNFEIIEINGAGSEATHIWDPKTSLLEAYAVLFAQWKILFSIGAQVKKQSSSRGQVKVWQLLREWLRVIRRKDSLSVSS